MLSKEVFFPILIIAASGSLANVALLKQYFDVQAQRSATTRPSSASFASFRLTNPSLSIVLRPGVGLTSIRAHFMTSVLFSTSVITANDVQICPSLTHVQ